MRISLRSALAVLAVASGLATAATATQAAAPIGFKVTIPESQTIECSYAAGELDCLNYMLPASKTCDFGGPVQAQVLKATGKPKATQFCVDEAFHGWKKLGKGKVWSHGAFKCRVNKASTLRCTNRSGTHTIYRAGGLV